MRGEETQLIGCSDNSSFIENELFIFPGTHSKHILVKKNFVVDFKTYMTGEIFELLAKKSILASAVDFTSNIEETLNLESFLEGISESCSSNILHGLFKVRTNQLFNKNTKVENLSYLSGLLIGHELKDLKFIKSDKINLIAGADFAKIYSAALAQIGIQHVNCLPAYWAEQAVIRGHLKIGRQLKLLV